jgi:hypothetical protein
MRNKTLIVLPILLSVIVLGCTTFASNVSAISRIDENIGKRIFIIPSSQDIDINDLLFLEFASDVKLALEINGYIVTSNVAEADQVVLLTYGISDPQKNTVMIPQIGKTAINSANTTGVITSGSNSSTFTGTTVYNYDYGVTHYIPTQQTVFTRVLVLVSYDWKVFSNTQQKIQLWKTDVVSTGSSGDLREVFPYLVLASEKYIGTNTGKSVKVFINKLDKNVTKYKTN